MASKCQNRRYNAELKSNPGRSFWQGTFPGRVYIRGKRLQEELGSRNCMITTTISRTGCTQALPITAQEEMQSRTKDTDYRDEKETSPNQHYHSVGGNENWAEEENPAGISGA